MSSEAGQKSQSLAALGLTAQGGKTPQITGLAVDSREVKDGTLFFALPGSRVHGAEFIQYALRNGTTVMVLNNEYGVEAENAANAPSARAACQRRCRSRNAN